MKEFTIIPSIQGGKVHLHTTVNGVDLVAEGDTKAAAEILLKMRIAQIEALQIETLDPYILSVEVEV